MYDAIIVGARVSGAPTAMLLAQKGHRVLLVDRAGFPSDTLSTHYIHQPGVAALDRWGVLPQVRRTGPPAIRSMTLDVGPFALRGAPPAIDGVDAGLSPRRFALDSILVEAAASAGAEVRERFSVQELLWENGRVTGIRGRTLGGATVTERARVVVGADGRGSSVARSVRARSYYETPALTCAFYTYWSGVQMDGAELYPRPGRMIVAAPTSNDLVVTIAFWPQAEFHRVRRDLEREFMDTLELAPSLAERVRSATSRDRFRGTARLPNYFRRPFGEGWALVGDAGYHRDPILAWGISDAFRDAELLSEALDGGLSGRASLLGGLAEYEGRRNEAAAAHYDTTLRFARLEPPPPAMQQLFAALVGNQPDTDRLFGTFAGTVAPSDFFAPENVGRIIGAQPAVV